MKLKEFFIYMFIFTLGTLLYGEKTITEVKYKKIELNSLEDINNWKNSDELYVFSEINVDLKTLSAAKKKEAFINILLPAINIVNTEIRNNKKIVETLSQKKILTSEEKIYAENLFKKYRVEYGNWEELNSRLIIYPTSLILTQGALESAWATSRFFKEGNNLFGMWSTNPDEPRIPAKGKRENGFVPHLKKYDNVKDSVADFVLNLSRNNAYNQLRELLNQNHPPEIIAKGLVKYSEEGDTYVKKVVSTMKYNNLTIYDNYIE